MAEKVDKVEKWDVEGCIVNVANVVAVEGVVVGDAEDVPSSIVESVLLVVVVLVQAVFPTHVSSFPRLLGPWFLVPGPWTRSTRDRRVLRRVSTLNLIFPFILYNTQTHTHAPSSLDTLLRKTIRGTGQ